MSSAKSAAPSFVEMKALLQKHQIALLSETYRDLTEDSRWKRLSEFFLTDVYLVGDGSSRNESFMKLSRQFERLLDSSFRQGLGALIELHQLSEKLDDKVSRMLMTMGVGYTLELADYERAYRYVDNYDERIRQLDYIDQTLSFVHQMASRRWMGFVIGTMQATARIAGVSAMVDFLDRGYSAFRSVPDITVFRTTIRSRELARLDRIYREIPMDSERSTV